MATISATVGPYTASMEVPTDEQLLAANTADLMIEIGKLTFQDIADDAQLDTTERTAKLAVISALLLKFVQLRADNVPPLEITPT